MEKKNKEFTCKICKKKFKVDNQKKIRQRTVYCSKECADYSHTQQMLNFWTNKVNYRLVFK